MRVLIAVGHGGIYSGGSHQALYALAGLKKAGVDVTAVWGPDVEDDPDGFRRLKDLDIPLKLMPINHPATWSSIRQFRDLLKSFKPDVVECVKGRAQHHIIFSSLGLRRHGIVFYRGVSRALDPFQALKYRLRRVDRIIANCQALKQTMIQTGKIRPDKIDVVYGEFDPACADPAMVNAEGLRQELDIPETVPLITQLGNWADWRGQAFMIEAASILKRQGRPFHVLFAGRETEKLLPVVEKHGMDSCVTLSPYRRDPERVLKASDIIVNASTGIESLSGALVNAQAMALPAVTTAISGSVEIVDDGVTGFIVAPGDSKALAAGISRLLDMPDAQRKSVGEAARQRALKMFSPAARVEQRLKCYERAIENRK